MIVNIKKLLVPFVMAIMVASTILSAIILIRQPKPPSKPYMDYIDSVYILKKKDNEELKLSNAKQEKYLEKMATQDSMLLSQALINLTNITKSSEKISKNRNDIKQLKKRQNEIGNFKYYNSYDLQRAFAELEK